MAETTILANDFSAGWISPKQAARAATPAYQKGCRQLENWLPTSTGELRPRPGTYYLGNSYDDTSKARLVPFRGRLANYMMELTDSKARFWKEDHTLLGSPLEIVTPWDEEEMFEVQYDHLDDSLYLVHGGYDPRQISELVANTPTIATPKFTGSRTWSVPPKGPWSASVYAPELDIIVAVGSPYPGIGTRVLTSPDGINWTPRVSAADNHWIAVCWSPERSLFVALADDGTVNDQIMTSPDGIKWTRRTSPSARQWASVCWAAALGLFVAVAGDGTTAQQVMTSADGITWTARASAEANAWKSVAWSPQKLLLVAVAATGTHRVMTSANGTSWATQSASDANDWSAVCWAPELSLWVAVSSGGVNNHRAMTSPDAITWTGRVASTAQSSVSVAWSTERHLLVAVGYSGSANLIMTSPDGITWADRTAAFDASWYSVIWVPTLGKFVSFGSGGTGSSVQASVDGISWSLVTSYPRICAVNAGRLVLGSPLSQPTCIGQSRAPSSSGYRPLSFDVGTNPDDAIISYHPDGGRLRWVKASRRLAAGSDLATWMDNGTLPTPATFYMVPGEAVSSPSVQAVTIGNAIFYVGGPEPSLHMLVYSQEGGGLIDVPISDGYEHLFESGIVEMTAMVSPAKILWLVRTDGKMISCTFGRTGWGFALHSLGGGGLVESAAVMRTATGDELWMSVKRGANRCIEYLTIKEDTDQEDLHYVDSGIVYDGGATATIPGLDHLEGLPVIGIGDGGDLPAKTVASGVAVFDRAVSKAHVGLSYSSIFRTLPPELPINGTWQGKKKRADQLILRLYRSRGGSAGQILAELRKLNDLDLDGIGLDENPELFTGDYNMDVGGVVDTEGSLYVVRDGPWPITLLGLIARFTIMEG